jgi:hypothetical protein
MPSPAAGAVVIVGTAAFAVSFTALRDLMVPAVMRFTPMQVSMVHWSTC